MDPEVAKMFAYNNPMGDIGSDIEGDFLSRRLSMNDGSDLDSNGNLFGFRTGALSAITAPVGGYNPNTSPSQGQRLGLGTASISGGIANRHPPQDSFLNKFSNVAEATRDIELSNNFGKLNLDSSNSRRTSFGNGSATTPPGNSGSNSNSNATGSTGGSRHLTDVNYGSPTGSLNESLNNTRNSRHQSISDKIDHYNSTSPIQGSATLMSAELKEDKLNIWNPATAALFTPSYGPGPAGPGAPPAQFPPGPGNEMYYNRANPMSPPFMMVSPPMQFMDPRMYSMNFQPTADSPDSLEESPNKSEKGKEHAKREFPHTPGIGMSRQMNPQGYMFHSFNPYNMYQQSPPLMNVAVQEESEASTPEMSLNKSPSQTAEDSSNTNTPPQGGSNGNGRKKGNPKASNGGKGAPHIYRSPLLEEVRSNFKGKEYYLKDIYGHAVEFTKDQHGSRFIQQKLPTGSAEEKEVIFNEIRDISFELMTDVFGNYVIQKYFEHGSTTQKNVLLEYMLGHIYDLSLQMYGCRVVQRALEAISLDGQIKIISELRNSVLICAKDQNGNHVIQKSIERIPFENVRFILDSLENQIYHLSTHPYGCRVIQRLLEFSSELDQKKILSELNRFIFYLIQDQYGNYVMQHILERGSQPDKEAILKIVLGSVVNFSKHKFASNVIEKCIKFGSNQQRRQILHEVLLGNEDLAIELVEDDSPLALMMKDQYANYVIQKLVEGFDTKSEEKRLLVLKLRQYLKQISSKNTYGKHLASVEKMIIVAETALIEAENS